MDTIIFTKRFETFTRFARFAVIFLALLAIVGFLIRPTGETAQADSLIWRDDFTGTLAGGWHWENENPAKWNLTEQPGFLRIYTSQFATGVENLLLRTVSPGDFVIKTRLLFEPDTNFQIAGLVIWQDASNFLQLGRAFCDIEGPCVGNAIYFDKILGGVGIDSNFGKPVNSPSEAYLRLERRGDMVRAFFSYEGITWFEIGTHWIPPDFQVNGVGLTASQDYYTPDWDVPADFDFFELTEGWGFLPEGFHDFDSGNVPSSACNAGGWAADPDDRAADLWIEINVDGEIIATPYASEYRQDLYDAGVCVDGNCSFFTSLWGEISSYEPHSVVVYAQDIPSGEWVQLSNSPKDLTCRSYDIYAYDPLTGETMQLTDLRETDEYNPSWSPNGKKVAHDVVSADSHAIFITDVKTGVSAPLAGAEDGGNDAAWSQNGKWIVFDRYPFGDPSLYLVPSEGGARTLVREDAVSADWAPNGKRLVFQQPSDGSIRTISLDGGAGASSTLSAGAGTLVAESGETLIAESGAHPSWSPDGNWIAYEKDGDIWKVQVNVRGRVFGEPIQMTSGPFLDDQPTWSTDSQAIIYHSGLSRDSDLWTIPAAGGEPTWLTGAPEFGDYDPASAKNSSSVAYASFSPWGQAARTWVAAYTHDLPAGYWSPGDHRYHFEADWNGGSTTSPELLFNVSSVGARYDGTVLLRTASIWARVGDGCTTTDTFNRTQPTQFHVGWTTDGTYPEAVAFFDSTTSRAVWDEGESAELAPHEIIPFRLDDWWPYVCSYTAGPPKMDLRVNYGHDWVESFYEAGHEVVITVTDGAGVEKATATVFTEPKDFWGGATGFQTIPEDWSPAPPDLQPNDWVYAQVDNGVIAQVQLGDISGMIDLETDSVAGTISAPWLSSEVNVECHPWGAPGPTDMKFDTIWPDDADLYTCAWDPLTEWDIQAGQIVGVGYFASDGHWVANVIPNPRLIAFPESNNIFGYGWPVGSEVHLAINNPPDFTQTVTVGPAPWDPNDIMAYFDFRELYDLEPGDVVTLSGSGMERIHTVQDLAITAMNAEANIVSGTTTTGAEVHAWVHGFGESEMQVPVVDGTWLADFDDVGFDLLEGMCGRSEIRDENNNATAVDWCVPNPRMVIFPVAEWFDGLDWPDGATVAISVAGKPECYLEKESWGHFFNGNFPEGCDVAIGDSVTFTDGVTPRTHVVQNLAVSDVNEAENTVVGAADPGVSVHVWPHGYNELVPTADASGNWTADFDEIGFDLLEGMCGRSEIRDASNSATAVDWCVPNPRSLAWADWEYIQGFDWPLGVVVHLTVDDPTTDGLDHQQDGTVVEMPWDPNGRFGWVIYEFGDQYNMKVDDVVTLSYAGIIRSHTIRTLAVTDVNASANTVTGIADPYAVIYTWPFATWQTLLATADGEGNWQVDYTELFDLVPGECGRAEVHDSIGNATALDWCVP